MRKYSKKQVMICILMLAMSMAMLTSCGSPKSLEEIVEKDAEIKKDIESYETDGMKISVKENTLLFTYTFGENDVPDGMEDIVKETIKDSMESQKETYEGFVHQLEEDTEIKDIKLKMTYESAAGEVLYEHTYETKAD